MGAASTKVDSDVHRVSLVFPLWPADFDQRHAVSSVSFLMISLCNLAIFLQHPYIPPAKLFPNVSCQQHNGGRSPTDQ
jgi:hypothetical protein